MITATTDIIKLPIEDNSHFCGSCGNVLTKCVRINFGTGITEGITYEFCPECANELTDELIRELR